MCFATNRREFLRRAAGSALGTMGTVAATSVGNRCRSAPLGEPLPLPEDPQRRKLIVVVFGGGTRSSEAIDDSEHRYVPNLWNKLVPHGT